MTPTSAVAEHWHTSTPRAANSSRSESLAQRERQCRAGDQRPPEGGGVHPRLCRGIEQNFQIIRRSEIAAGPEMRDRLDLLLGIAGASRDDRATERMRARFHHEAARGEMIGKRIVHDIARAEARGEERARHAPKIFARALRLEYWSRRDHHPPPAC